MPSGVVILTVSIGYGNWGGGGKDLQGEAKPDSQANLTFHFSYTKLSSSLTLCVSVGLSLTTNCLTDFVTTSSACQPNKAKQAFQSAPSGSAF